MGRTAHAREPQTLGQVIRTARLAHGYSTWQLAERSGVSQTSVSRLEHDEAKQPSATHLTRLSPVLEIAAAELFALAGYTAPADLPTLPTYLRTKYRDYPCDAREELEKFIESFVCKYNSPATPRAPNNGAQAP